MARYIKGTGSKNKLCSWRCVHCNSTNLGVAVITVTGQQSYGAIGTTRSKAEENVKTTIKDELEKKAQTVNDRHIIPNGVGINSKCSSCGQKQPWGWSNAYPALRIIGGIILGILAASLLSPYLTKIDGGDIFSFFLLFMTVVLVASGVVAGSGKIIQMIIAKKMSPYGEEYFPKLLDPPEKQQ